METKHVAYAVEVVEVYITWWASNLCQDIATPNKTASFESFDLNAGLLWGIAVVVNQLLRTKWIRIVSNTEVKFKSINIDKF